MARLCRYLVPVALFALVSLAPTAEAANVKAKTSLTKKSGATRIVAKLTSKRKLGKRKQPRAVKVKIEKRSYKLKRARGASAAAVKLGTWRSDPYRGRAARKLDKAAGKRVMVEVTSRAGTTTLRSTLKPPAAAEPVPVDDPLGGDDPPPTGGDDPPPTGGDETPPAGAGDITGQQAIDQMTQTFSDNGVKRFQNSTDGNLTSSFALHLCGDGRFRWYWHETFVSGDFSNVSATEKTGQPWTVTEALIRGDGSYMGAVVEGTFTEERRHGGGGGPINEPAQAVIEQQNGQWYWDKQPAEVIDASCDPTL